MFRINQNVMSINGQRNLFKTEMSLNKAMERLGSGLRINRAADDAAGLSASEGMRSQLAGARESNKNISRDISMLQTADAGLEQMGEMLIRLKELAVAAADSSTNNNNRQALSLEADGLVRELNRIAQGTSYNGITLIGQTSTGMTFTFYVGNGSLNGPGGSAPTAGISVAFVTFLFTGVSIGTVGAGTIGLTAFLYTVANLLSQGSALALVSVAEQGVLNLAKLRTQIGAMHNRLERAQLNIQNEIEQTANAESIIRDADFAVEASNLTRAQILVQSGTSILQQANLAPQNALALLS
jgi:flagellin